MMSDEDIGSYSLHRVLAILIRDEPKFYNLILRRWFGEDEVKTGIHDRTIVVVLAKNPKDGEAK